MGETLLYALYAGDHLPQTSATMPAALYYIMCTRATPCGVVETMSDAPRNAAAYYSSAV
ncbi:hypothetical protein JJE63_04715 [Alloprevotella tannerae]|uniref:hypothetical protein n=1 Tax=Alloprevotella tannerae TaxID=76122 RepID=UPI001ED9EB57|nr:hypothetical protein [Alloprevotella tannerae]MCG2652630.1 hypothetical protein [Alloprevotella tannerae]